MVLCHQLKGGNDLRGSNALENTQCRGKPAVFSARHGLLTLPRPKTGVIVLEKAPSSFPRLRLSSSSPDWALCYPDNEPGAPVSSWPEAPTPPRCLCGASGPMSLTEPLRGSLPGQPAVPGHVRGDAQSLFLFQVRTACAQAAPAGLQCRPCGKGLKPAVSRRGEGCRSPLPAPSNGLGQVG